MSRYIFARCVDPVTDNLHRGHGAETIDGAMDLARRIYNERKEPAYVFDTLDARGKPVPRGLHWFAGWRWLKRCRGGADCEAGKCKICCGAKYVEDHSQWSA